MIKLNQQLLDSIGLAELPAVEKKAILQHIYDSLETRVGARFASTMTDDQLDHFDEFIKNKDDAGAFNFLQTNFPNYKDIVQEEFVKLRNEVESVAPQILAESKKALASGTPSPFSAPTSPDIPPQQYAPTTPNPAPQYAPTSEPQSSVTPPTPAPQYEPPTPPAPQSAPAPNQPYVPPASNYQPPQQYRPAPVDFNPSEADSPNQQPPAGTNS